MKIYDSKMDLWDELEDLPAGSPLGEFTGVLDRLGESVARPPVDFSDELVCAFLQPPEQDVVTIIDELVLVAAALPPVEVADSVATDSYDIIPADKFYYTFSDFIHWVWCRDVANALADVVPETRFSDFAVVRQLLFDNLSKCWTYRRPFMTNCDERMQQFLTYLFTRDNDQVVYRSLLPLNWLTSNIRVEGAPDFLHYSNYLTMASHELLAHFNEDPLNFHPESLGYAVERYSGPANGVGTFTCIVVKADEFFGLVRYPLVPFNNSHLMLDDDMLVVATLVDQYSNRGYLEWTIDSTGTVELITAHALHSHHRKAATFPVYHENNHVYLTNKLLESFYNHILSCGELVAARRF